MDRNNTLRSAEVRLLGTAQARHRGGDERTHAAVGDDRRACSQPFFEAAHATSVMKG
jgi:hypothetical protein